VLALPLALTPPAPFPLVTQSLVSTEFVAPGIRRMTCDLQTVAGPLRVRLVEADPHEATLRLGVVVASDALVSGGETISSMAHRTGAVAGINADYFDIGATNEPLNAVVEDGALVRTPSTRAVLMLTRARAVRFGSLAFAGSVAYGTAVVPLTHVGEWPPEGGASFVQPSFGRRGPAAGVTELQLDPLLGTSRDGFSGSYRVRSSGAATAGVPSGPTLGFGPAALAVASPPQPGDEVTIAGDTMPPLATLELAIGGGPLLVTDGAPAVDPNAPAPSERDHRFPVSGAATLPDGSLLLIAVDGRRPALSIGLTRPEFGALLQGLGATDGMAFDSGGSAEIVWRELGDAAAGVANSPSDGEERRVADGLFVYSDAPAGTASRLVVRPAAIEALPGVRVLLHAFAVDAAGHARGAVRLDGGDALRAAATPGSERRVVRAGALAATVPVRTLARVAALRIDPPRAAVASGDVVSFGASGVDERGAAVAIGTRLRWSSDRGSIDATGRYRAAARDGTVTLHAGAAVATARVLVGDHDAAVATFDRPGWTYASAPRGLPGAVATTDGTLRLDFDLTSAGRAAYANFADGIVLPGEPERLSIDVVGDSSGAGLRASVTNRFGERQSLTLANRVDWRGPRRLTIALPPDLNAPVTLFSLYAVRALAGPPAPVPPHGTILFRRLSVDLPGTP